MTRPATYAHLDDLIVRAVTIAPVFTDDLYSTAIEAECQRLGPLLGVEDVKRLLDRRVIALRRAGSIRSRRRHLILP
ncbi:hypothetical protein [Paraburkholderia domus]|uniref:hypothetical protein n=1 Tax=Paraburkholderia domus TaxID=2793075 RepID=UPI00191352E9|nr:hypothetical protein [Paraburkholderia domus]MBK5064833.1 hypothetical protein [Burkholderia sp. R-70199]CAE6967409.1 hypothetical protein R70199_07842 [Paraburkholderia domus]